MLRRPTMPKRENAQSDTEKQVQQLKGLPKLPLSLIRYHLVSIPMP